MTMRADPAVVDLKYRAKRSAQRPADYAASVEIYRRPRNWMAYAIAAAIIAAGAIALGMMR